eukprot:923707-Prorocentrum_minimum.AAC.1
MSVQLDDARGYIWLTLIGRAQVLGLAPREQQCASPAYEALHLRHVALCHSAARAAHAWGAPVELLGGPGGSAPLSRVPPGAVLSVVRGAMELYPSSPRLLAELARVEAWASAATRLRGTLARLARARPRSLVVWMVGIAVEAAATPGGLGGHSAHRVRALLERALAGGDAGGALGNKPLSDLRRKRNDW